jgi:hypothetical protein
MSWQQSLTLTCVTVLKERLLRFNSSATQQGYDVPYSLPAPQLDRCKAARKADIRSDTFQVVFGAIGSTELIHKNGKS